MAETQLTDLALLNIHRDIDVDIEKVIQRFSKTKKITVSSLKYLNDLSFISQS